MDGKQEETPDTEKKDQDDDDADAVRAKQLQQTVLIVRNCTAHRACSAISPAYLSLLAGGKTP